MFEPEDIFSATDKTPAGPPVSPSPGPPSALAQGKLQPVGNSTPAVPLAQVSGNVGTRFPFKKAIGLAAVSLVVVGSAGAAWFWWQTRGQVGPGVTMPPQGSPTDQAPAAASQLRQTLENVQEKAVNRALDPLGADEVVPSDSALGQPAAAPTTTNADTADTDGDGLNDGEELGLGTNARLVDTDGDGLADWEEVKIFTTNPLLSDTDGDTYSDGLEVQNGYNPKGAGKLLDFQKAKEEIK